jgi:N-acetylglucosaminyldiphosphoundecaprenol N-acetyl-beta-D-mannosaminyltransferase
MTRERLYILGIPIDPFTFETWLDQVGAWVNDPAPSGLHHICTVNPEFVMIAQEHPAFYDVLQRADACLADGVGILLAARLMGCPLPERVTGSDGVPRLAERAAREGWRVFLLGAQPGVADLAAQKLSEANPSLSIVGTNPGNPTPEEAEAIIAHINRSQADILLVAYGAPTQDVWIDEYRNRLQVKAAMGVGGALDFAAGVLPRAPLWMRRLYLEWLYRLYLQPWRWRRMLRLPRFVVAVLRYRSAPTPRAGQVKR